MTVFYLSTVEEVDHAMGKEFKQLFFNEAQHTLCIDDQCVKIEPLIARALLFFLANKNTVIERKDLMQALWHSQHVSDDAINRMISTLRRNLHCCLGGERHEFVETIPRVGYCFHLPENIQIKETEDIISDSPDDHASTSLNHPFSHAYSPKKSLSAPHQQTVSEANSLSFLRKERKTFVFFSLLLAVLTSSLVLYSVADPTLNTPTTADEDPKTRVHIAMIISETDHPEALLFARRLTSQLTEGLTQTLAPDVRVFLPLEDSFSRDNRSSNSNTALQHTFTTQVQGRFTQTDHSLRLAIHVIDMQTRSLDFADSIEIGNHVGSESEQKRLLLAESLAALRLHFLHQDKQVAITQYGDVKNELGYRGLERLITNNIALRKFETNKAAETITDLLNWRKTYPEHPAIKGQLAFAYAIMLSLGNKNDQQSSQSLQLANQVLQDSPANLDALLTLYHHYNDYASMQAKAEYYYQLILQHHAYHPDGYQIGLSRQIRQFQTCNSLNYFVNAGRDFIDPVDFRAVDSLLSSCVKAGQDENLSTTLSVSLPAPQFNPNGSGTQASSHHRSQHIDAMHYQTRYIKMVKRFSLARDDYFKAVNLSSLKTPHQRNLSELYQQYLALDEKRTVNYLEQRLDLQSKGYWSWLNTLYGFHYNRDLPTKPTDFLDFVRDNMYGETDWYFITALIKQVREENIAASVLSNYLLQAPVIENRLMNIETYMGLLALQRQVRSELNHIDGNQTQQLITLHDDHQSLANQLNQQLEDYWQQAPTSYRFWGLGRYHFVVALYVDDESLANSILEQRFHANEAWWQHDLALMQETLYPWQNTPLVQRYLQRIEDNLAQARKTLL